METVNAATRAWLEVSDEQGRLAVRLELGTRPVSLGRALDNDVVLDDHHVAHHHARVQRNAAGTWQIEDLGSRNGLLVTGKRKREPAIVLGTARAVNIGRCRVRLRTLADPLPTERPLDKSTVFWLLGLGGLVLLSILMPTLRWLDSARELDWSDHLPVIIASLSMVGVWSLVWAGATRIFTPHLRYLRHLSIICGLMISMAVWSQLANVVSYAFSWVGLGLWQGVAWGPLLGLAIWLHLRTISRQRAKAKLIAALAIAVVICGLNIAIKGSNLDKQPQVLQHLAPPALRLAGPLETRAFFSRVDALQPGLEQAREEKLLEYKEQSNQR